MAISHRKHVEPHKHTANDIVGNYVATVKTSSSTSTFPSYTDYFTITKKLTMKDPADVDGDYIELNVEMLEDPEFPGTYNPFLEISEGIYCHKDIESYGGFVGSASAAGVTGGGCIQIGDRFEDMSDPSRINLTGASTYVAITKGSTIAGEAWDLNAVLAGLKCNTIYADNIKKVNGDSWSIGDSISGNIYDYKVLRNGDYYEGLDCNGVLKYGGEDDLNGVSGSNAAAVINKCLSDIADASGGLLYIDKAEYAIDEQIVIPATITTNPGERAYIEILSPRAVLKINENLAANAISLSASTTHYSLKIKGLSVFCHSKSDDYYALYIADAMYIFLEDFEAGWEGIYIKNTDTIFINNLYAVDCAGEGLKLEDVGYCFASNFFIDNCGGWGGIAGHDAILLRYVTRAYFTNFNLFGEKGIYGGQEYGIYMDTVGFSHFSNFQVDGFIKGSIKCEQCNRLTFTNFELINSGEHPLNFISNATYASEDITISNFNIYVSNNQDGISFYAQNSKNIERAEISNGFISGTGDGIVINDDSSGAKCQYISVNNVNIDVTGYGISEGGISDNNLFSNINAKTSPGGIITVGANTKITNSWDYTNFITSDLDVLTFTVGAGGVSANDIVAIQADNTVFKAKFTTNGEKVIGVVLQTKSEGQTVHVKVNGVATVIADDTINPGDRIAASNSTAGRGVEWNSHAHTYGTLSTSESGAHIHTTSVDGEHAHGSGTLASNAETNHTHSATLSGNNDLEHLHSLYIESTPFDGNTNNGLGTKSISVSGTTGTSSHGHTISGSVGDAGDHYHATDQSQDHTHSVSGNTGSYNNGYVIGKALTSATVGNSFTMLIIHGA